ncbi:MAG: carbohydrate porin [Planctomycetaceae bacterium]|jgi:porin|nr:carbohydrate porin [Planctomycetaceae bacterium]
MNRFQPLYCLLFLLAGSVPLCAQTGGEDLHPDPETRLRVPIDQNYAAAPSSSTEGILGSTFPRIHGSDALHFDYEYTGGVFTNARGGGRTSHSTRYAGIFDMGITADTAKLGLWKNGTFYTHALFSHGENPSNWVGDWQGVAVFAYETPAQVSEYWYEHHFLDETVFVRAGKIDAGVDFFYLDSTENFVNASGTCVPTTGIPTAPGNAWGAMSVLNLSKNCCFKFGFFDADGDANQFWMSETGNVYTAYQFDYHYDLFKYLPGFAYIGAWYNDNENMSYAGGVHSGKSGYSVGVEQMIYRKNYLKNGDNRGLTFFTQFSQPQSDRENALRTFWGLGMRYLGFFENRPDDVLGFGVFQASFDRGLLAADSLPFANETAYEIHYHAHITDNAAVQPILQYVVHPGGRYRNAVVPGFSFQIVF